MLDYHEHIRTFLFYWMATDKIKQEFFQDVAVSVLLSKWNLTKCFEKKLHGNYSGVMYAGLKTSSKKHSEKQNSEKTAVLRPLTSHHTNHLMKRC